MEWLWNLVYQHLMTMMAGFAAATTGPLPFYLGLSHLMHPFIEMGLALGLIAWARHRVARGLTDLGAEPMPWRDRVRRVRPWLRRARHWTPSSPS